MRDYDEHLYPIHTNSITIYTDFAARSLDNRCTDTDTRCDLPLQYSHHKPDQTRACSARNALRAIRWDFMAALQHIHRDGQQAYV